MACNDSCYLNCDPVISDQCVKYTGPDIPALGICAGDQLSAIEAIILNELQGALEGTGVVPENVTLENCKWLSDQFVGKDPNLSNLLQLLVDSECSLKSMIDVINEKLAANSLNFNTLCLQGLPPNPTIQDVVQSAVNLLCSINSTVASLPTTYVKLSDLPNLVNQYITQFNNAQSPSGTLQYFNYLPVGVALPYFGSLSNFDNTGKGLDSAGMKNLCLCNGLNNTPDLRGRVISGAVRNVPGGTLDPTVDPSNPVNSAGSTNYALNDKFGENFHTNTILETPSHSHTANDPGHKHTILRADGYSGSGDQATGYVAGGLSGHPQSQANTSVNTTGITISSTGGGQPHNNLQPSMAAYYIIRVA